MGVAGGALRARCTYGCANGAACTSKDVYEAWLIDELYNAINNQDVGKVEELLNIAPNLKELEVSFPGEQTPMSVLGVAINRRDLKVTRALLRAGVSPNLPISLQQRDIYERRSQLAALNGGDADVQNLVPGTHFEALCSTQHKEFFLLLLEAGANASKGLILTCHAGDNEMLEALLSRGADPNTWQRKSTPLVTAVKSKIMPYDKVLTLLRAGSDPNFIGPPAVPPATPCYPALVITTRKRDYRMVRILLEAGADVNLVVGEEGLPNALFWAVYWGELELIKLFITLSKHRLDLGVRKYTKGSVFDVARTSLEFAKMRKPRHIAKLPLPSRPAVVYEKIIQMLEEYAAQYPESLAGVVTSSTRSTTATRNDQYQSDRINASFTEKTSHSESGLG